MGDEPTAREHRWDHAPVEELLHDARPLTVSVFDRMTREGWEQLARHAGVPRRRWRRHHPVGDGPLVAIVDGQPAFDAAAWERFVSLVPGAVALPSRTAATFGVARARLQPPDRRLRVLDLLAARRRRRRIARAMRTIEADHARHSAAVADAVDAAIAPGDDDASFEQLPPYALAARLEQLLASSSHWALPPLVDLLSTSATARLLQLLGARGRQPGEALLEAARLQSGGGAQAPEHLSALAAIRMTAGPEQARLLELWRDGASGWHSMRELLLESPPLRQLGDAALELVPTSTDARAVVATVPEDDPELAEAAERARALTARRERLARDRALHVAGVRALTWSLARALERSGALSQARDAFDLPAGDLVRLARGVEVTVMRQPPAAADDERAPADGAVVALAAAELRGIPASDGVARGRVLVLADPAPDADVDGAVLVCRHTDPAWMPLLMRCAALVTERGGPLSHAAIVARELQLPTVVGVRGARAAATGHATATVDGAAGTVTFAPGNGSPA